MSKLFKLFLAATLSWFSLSANADYTFTLLGTPSGMRSVATAINNSGQVVGVIETDSTPYAMLWNNGAAIQLDTGASVANSINSSGQIAGYSDFNGAGFHASLWSNGGVTDLGSPGLSSEARGINDSGQVAGNAGFATIWNNGVATTLVSLDSTNMWGKATAINSSGQIVGYSATQGEAHATLWSNGVPSDLGTLGNGTSSLANSINNSGQVVGWSTSEVAGVMHAALWSNGVATNLGELGNDVGNYSQAWSINNLGNIVGLTYFSGGGGAATLWSNGNIIDLNTLLSASDVEAGWKLVDATAINDNGSIVGFARNNLLGITNQAFVLAAVPEADTSSMLLMGAGVMGFMARRRKNTQA